MNKYILTFIALMHFVANKASSQNMTYFGMEASFTNDVYEITETGDDLTEGPHLSGLWGFNLRQDVTNYFFVETGVIRKYYDSEIGFKPINISFASGAIDAWVIPLRLGTRLNIYKEKIYLVTVVGYSFCINSYYGYGNAITGPGFAKTANYSVSFSYSENTDLEKYFSLLQTGLGFELKLFKKIILSVSSSYYAGFENVIELKDITYTVNNSNTFTGNSISKGDFWSFGAGLKYPISNFWTKKKI